MGRSLDDVLEARSLDERSNEFIRQGNFAEALPLCERLVRLSPNIASRWSRLGWALSFAHRHGEAIEAYKTALSLDSDQGGAWLNLSGEYIQLSRYADALHAAECACALLPAGSLEWTKHAHTNRALAFLNLERREEAVAALDVVLSLAPDDADVWLLRGHTCARLQLFHEAEEAFLHAVALKPERPAGLKELIDLHRVHFRDDDKAMEYCERLLALSPDDESAWRLKGLILYDRRSYQEAALAFERALECKADGELVRARCWSHYGLTLTFLGRYHDALTAFDQSEALAPARTLLLNTRGVIYSRIERHAEALVWYEAAIKGDPDIAAWRLNKAEALACLGRYDEAESTLEDALVDELESFGALCVKGLVETRRGHYDDAMEAFTKSIQLDPRHGPTYVELASLLILVADAEHACQIAERATALDPCHARTWRIKAAALRAAGRLEEAAEAERHGAELLAEQTAQVDAYLQARAERGEPDG